MVTQAQVAAEAGVSRSTVSLVLGGRHAAVGISAPTVARVRETAARLGYQRQGMAAPSPFLCVLLSDPADELNARCLAAALETAACTGHRVQVLVRGAGGRALRAAAEELIAWRPAGVLAWDLPAARQAELAKLLAEHQVPLGAAQPHHGGQPLGPALDHLFALGHRRVALLAGPREPALEASFTETLAAKGQPADLVLTPELTSTGVREALRDALRGRKTRPTALVCTSDLAAMLVLRQARRLGVRVPKALSVVGWGDLALGAAADPPLTTVAPPIAELTSRAVARLLGSQPGEVGRPRLVIRRSTGAPAE